VTYPFNVSAEVGDVAEDVTGEVLEELKRWPLRRMKVAREGDIADNYCQQRHFTIVFAAVQRNCDGSRALD
jgi:hypothetical protein